MKLRRLTDKLFLRKTEKRKIWMSNPTDRDTMVKWLEEELKLTINEVKRGKRREAIYFACLREGKKFWEKVRLEWRNRFIFKLRFHLRGKRFNGVVVVKVEQNLNKMKTKFCRNFLNFCSQKDLICLLLSSYGRNALKSIKRIN